MKLKVLYCFLAITGTLLIAAPNGFSFSSYGTVVNNACAPQAPYTGDCALCHTSTRSAPTPAKTAYLAGGTTLTDYFCPPTTTPSCTDNDGDTYSVDGGNCGPVDCNDTHAGIHPGAVDIPNNGIDENCDGADHVDTTLLDNDGDGFSVAGGDCNDADALIYPGAVEICADSTDNDCDGLTDEDCDISCPDVDGDGYRDLSCGGTDCNDSDGTINPGVAEICDGRDNNCNSQIDDSGTCTSRLWTLMTPVLLSAASGNRGGPGHMGGDGIPGNPGGPGATGGNGGTGGDGGISGLGCGDGVVGGDEQCDDGNSINGDGCEISCTTTPPRGQCIDFVPLADLRGCNLSGQDLSGFNLYKADLSGANLSNTILVGTNLELAKIRSANLQGSDLSSARLNFATLSNSNLTEALLAQANLYAATVTGANLTFADLTAANLAGAKSNGSIMVGADLSGATLANGLFTGVNFTDAVLTGADAGGNANNYNGAIWSNTTCPDGTNSDYNGDTCVNNR